MYINYTNIEMLLYLLVKQMDKADNSRSICLTVQTRDIHSFVSLIERGKLPSCHRGKFDQQDDLQL